MKLVNGLIVGFSAVMMMGVSCKIVDPPVTTIRAENLKLADNDISGWSAGGSIFTSNGYLAVENFANFYEVIDGGATKYMGMTEGIIQELSSTQNPLQHFTAFILDFSTKEKAKEMVNTSISDFTDIQSLPTLPDTTAYWYGGSGSGVAYAYNSQFYFELQIFGYSDDLQARKGAEQILKAYFSKIK